MPFKAKSTFKDQVDERVEKVSAEIQHMMDQLPHYFRVGKANVREAGDKVWVELKPNATGEDWRKAITVLQFAQREVTNEMVNHLEAFKEFASAMQKAFKIIKDAYDIQGRAIVAICEAAEVDFDQIVSEWMQKRGVKGEAPPPPKEIAETKEETPQVKETVEEMSGPSLPF